MVARDAEASYAPAQSRHPEETDMVQLTLHNLDDALLGRLRTRALLSGRTLEEEVQAILVAAADLAPNERVAVVDRIAALTQGGQRDAADLQREVRDR